MKRGLVKQINKMKQTNKKNHQKKIKTVNERYKTVLTFFVVVLRYINFKTF